MESGKLMRTLVGLAIVLVLNAGNYGVEAQAQPQVPCFFILGDSLLDNGNNNGIADSLAKANYRPYGIDFPAGPTGRFSNGKTAVDVISKLLLHIHDIVWWWYVIIECKWWRKRSLCVHHPTAQLLGFSDYIPPYATTTGNALLKGVNYASAAAGIREETGRQLVTNLLHFGLCLIKQCTSALWDFLDREILFRSGFIYIAHDCALNYWLREVGLPSRGRCRTTEARCRSWWTSSEVRARRQIIWANAYSWWAWEATTTSTTTTCPSSTRVVASTRRSNGPTFSFNSTSNS